MSLRTPNRLCRLAILIGVLVLVFNKVRIVRAEYGYSFSCTSKNNCHECLQFPECTWCEQPDYSGFRCMSNYSLPGCPEKYRVHHDITEEITEVEEHTNVRIRPQRLNLKMPINQSHRFKVQYSDVNIFFPLDVYFLLDLSKSAESDKDKHFKMVEKVSQVVEKMTSNFRLGLGTLTKKKSEEPCDQCAPSYVFHNHLALSANSSTFRWEVENFDVSENVSSIESGYNALMEALAFDKHIGWRMEARRLLIFSADGRFSDDDRKLDDVATPNDEYNMDMYDFKPPSIERDYPSISQINQKVKENSVNIIFAVTQSQHSMYKKISKLIEGSFAAILSDDSSNVVELVESVYGKFSSSVEMKDNATSHVKITYYSACLTGGAEKQTSKCDGLKVGHVVSFTAEILITSCPPDPRDWKQYIQIYPVGINESLVIDLTMLCSCACENPSYKTYQEKSPKCNGFGTYMCGICVCDDLHDGQMCECSLIDIHATKNDFACRPDNTTGVADCSGHGTCVCGECKCEIRTNHEERFYGKYCECNNFSCDRNNQLLCSGPDHGTCECGQCHCLPEWEGSDCSCLKSKEPCSPPNGGEICSGHGECHCGQCN